MISFAHGNLTLDNVGKFYFLKNISMIHGDLVDLLQHVRNFDVVSANVGGLYYNDTLIEKDMNLQGKGLKDCLNEITLFAKAHDIPIEELSVVNLQILWYDEVIM